MVAATGVVQFEGVRRNAVYQRGVARRKSQ
jgi:hypothetical protein